MVFRTIHTSLPYGNLKAGQAQSRLEVVRTSVHSRGWQIYVVSVLKVGSARKRMRYALLVCDLPS